MSTNNTPAAGTAAWRVATLTESAQRLAKSGNLVDAEKLFEQILEAAPYHIRSLNFLSTRAMERGDYSRARALLERALKADASRPIVYQNLGLVLKAENDVEGALRAFQAATKQRDNFVYSWIYQGQIHKEAGRSSEAIQAYAHALTLLPSLEATLANPAIPEAKRTLIRDAVLSLNEMKYAFFLEALTDTIAEHGVTSLQRILDSASIKAGLMAPVYQHALQRPDWIYLPGIHPEPFFSTDQFQWIPELELHTTEIRDELQSLLEESDVFEAYVNLDHEDTRQWKTLNHSQDWSSFHLYRAGKSLVENCQRCPVTADVLARLPLVKIEGHAPEAFFSILKPGTHIPPHHGLGNYKLAVHLPLIIPADCAIRAGHETRAWEEGKCLIFDDSFQHEAWNNSKQIRAVLIFEIWNPALTEAERRGMSALVVATNTFHARYGV
ncbi:MAG: aspartyl/asparaginyl beta-hydroxylase domain-containing protein [Gammaproteobacteria bacterium]